MVQRKNEALRIGGKLRRLRRERGLTQAQLAAELGVSPSYLNLIEHDRRNVTAALLLKIAQMFALDLGDLAGDDDSRLLADAMEMFGDAVFEDQEVTTTDVRDLVAASPAAARAVLALYDAYRAARDDLRTLAERAADRADAPLPAEEAWLPAEMVSDFIQANGNHFPELEAAAEAVREAAGLERLDYGDAFGALVRYLEAAFAVRTAVLPPQLRHGTVRRFDPVARTLVVSEALRPSGRRFQVAQQIALLAAGETVDRLLAEGGIDGEARALGRVALANYTAAAILMPYAPFLAQAQALRYDVELLEHRFGCTFEQVSHRLTTLQRPGASGVPFHLLRVDIAGNISKRFSLSGIRIPRHHGVCPRWNVYAAYMTPGQISVQVSEFLDGTTYFCIARTVRKVAGGFGAPQSVFAIGLGCDIEHARHLVYADGIDLRRTVPVGVACRICERMDCQQRAFPPLHRRLGVDENVRGLSAYVTPR